MAVLYLHNLGKTFKTTKAVTCPDKQFSFGDGRSLFFMPPRLGSLEENPAPLPITAKWEAQRLSACRR